MANTPNMLTVTIDGIRTQVPEGTLLIEAARQVGVMVPHFCYHPKLAPDANCRMCLVEIEKIPKLSKHTQHLSLIHISEPTRPY